MALRYGQQPISIWRPSAILDLEKNYFSSCGHFGNENWHIHTKFHPNRMIRSGSSDIEENIFKISAIRRLEFSKNCYVAHVAYQRVILLPIVVLITRHGAEI